MTATIKILKLQNEAFERGVARDGAITIRRFPQRKDHAHLSHVPAYRYQFYVNGNRISQKAAERWLTD